MSDYLSTDDALKLAEVQRCIEAACAVLAADGRADPVPVARLLYDATRKLGLSRCPWCFGTGLDPCRAPMHAHACPVCQPPTHTVVGRCVEGP